MIHISIWEDWGSEVSGTLRLRAGIWTQLSDWAKISALQKAESTWCVRNSTLASWPWGWRLSQCGKGLRNSLSGGWTPKSGERGHSSPQCGSFPSQAWLLEDPGAWASGEGVIVPSPKSMSTGPVSRKHTPTQECTVPLYALTHAHPSPHDIWSSRWCIISSQPHIRAASSSCLCCVLHNCKRRQSHGLWCDWHTQELSNIVALVPACSQSEPGRLGPFYSWWKLMLRDSQWLTSPWVTERVSVWSKICVILYLLSPRHFKRNYFILWFTLKTNFQTSVFLFISKEEPPWYKILKVQKSAKSKLLPLHPGPPGSHPWPPGSHGCYSVYPSRGSLYTFHTNRPPIWCWSHLPVFTLHALQCIQTFQAVRFFVLL